MKITMTLGLIVSVAAGLAACNPLQTAAKSRAISEKTTKPGESSEEIKQPDAEPVNETKTNFSDLTIHNEIFSKKIFESLQDKVKLEQSGVLGLDREFVFEGSLACQMVAKNTHPVTYTHSCEILKNKWSAVGGAYMGKVFGTAATAGLAESLYKSLSITEKAEGPIKVKAIELESTNSQGKTETNVLRCTAIEKDTAAALALTPFYCTLVLGL